jgi:hypothetical protein
VKQSEIDTLRYAFAKASSVLNEIEEALGPQDSHLLPLIVLSMVAVVAEDRETPSFKITESVRALRSFSKVERV